MKARRGGAPPPPPPPPRAASSQSQQTNLRPTGLVTIQLAMEFATMGLSTLLPKLAQLLQDDYNLHKGTRKGIECLYRELEAMHAALRRVGEVPREQLEELQKIWARDVRELSYDIEDIIDTFMVRVQGPDSPSESSAKEFVKKVFNIVDLFTKAKARHDIAKKINDIKERVKEVADRRDRYNPVATTVTPANVVTAPANKTLVDPRISALYTKVTELVGIGEVKEEVIERLAKEDNDQILISIAGFGGLGKTTLAKVVYDEIKPQFHCTAFVSVSRIPDAKKLLKDMMYQLDKEKFKRSLCSDLDEINRFIELIREVLRNKRYLIVIDDIWDKEPWEVIRLALIKNDMRSRIITTTRIIDVAEHVGGCYRLKPLSDESSEMLFHGRIFGSKDKCPRKFSEVSEKILKKCGGVPLAIITTSSLLANKPEDIKVWYDVCDSIGSGLGRNNPGMDSMRKILLLSYYDLPSDLKTCLLYLSVFPEDYVIRKDQLIWRWIAEGFIHDKKGDQSFFEIGESYFNELLNRSLIQPVNMDNLDGTPHACRVHDTVLDLIISMSVEERFIITTVLGDGMESKAVTTISGDGMESKVRRLSLHNTTTWPTMKMPKLRSLTIFALAGGAVIYPTPSHSSYLLLRVLDLRGCNCCWELASLGFLGRLSHLRYLGVSSIHTCYELPVEIGKLRFLQTLDLSETEVGVLSSSVIRGLGQLMCLRGSGCFDGTMLLDGAKKLTSLQVLELANVTSRCIAEELGHLNQLRVLDVKIGFFGQDVYDMELCTKALVESLGKLKKIESVHICYDAIGHPLCFDSSMEEPLGHLRRLRIKGATKVPTWIRPALLPSLSYLDIILDFVRVEDLDVLGTLPCLRHLKLKELSILVHKQQGVSLEKRVVGPEAFPSAVRCEFDTRGLGMVPSTFPPGAMPGLQDFTFSIRRARRVKSGAGSWESPRIFTVGNDDDLSLGHLPSLRIVTVVVVVVGLYSTYTGDEENMLKSLREKLEREAAVHPNHPRIHWSESREA